MGAGDWIMCTSQIRNLHARNRIPVLVVGLGGRVHWSPIFENNPRIARKPSRGVQRLMNGPGIRPYIASKTEKNWTWKKWPIAPGEIFLSQAEKDFAAQYAGRVLIEPNTKVANGNKAWPFERWQAVADSGAAQFLQVGGEGSRRLDGVPFVQTELRPALAILAASRGFVGSEGALHHAAAAFDVPAVVLWSHFIDVSFTGYATQTNLRHASGWCGSRTPCAECAASMARITVDEVVGAIKSLKGSA